MQRQRWWQAQVWMGGEQHCAVRSKHPSAQRAAHAHIHILGGCKLQYCHPCCTQAHPLSWAYAEQPDFLEPLFSLVQGSCTTWQRWRVKI